MLKDKWLSISIFTLAFSVLLSGLWIHKSILQLGANQQNAIQNASHTLSNNLNELDLTVKRLIPTHEPNSNQIPSLVTNPDNMYLSDAAKYLDISSEELTQIINDSTSGLPFLKTQNNVYIFNKKSLDKWLEKSYILPYSSSP